MQITGRGSVQLMRTEKITRNNCKTLGAKTEALFQKEVTLRNCEVGLVKPMPPPPPPPCDGLMALLTVDQNADLRS